LPEFHVERLPLSNQGGDRVPDVAAELEVDEHAGILAFLLLQSLKKTEEIASQQQFQADLEKANVVQQIDQFKGTIMCRHIKRDDEAILTSQLLLPQRFPPDARTTVSQVIPIVKECSWDTLRWIHGACLPRPDCPR
jgi:hypothetical protein